MWTGGGTLAHNGIEWNRVSSLITKPIKFYGIGLNVDKESFWLVSLPSLADGSGVDLKKWQVIFTPPSDRLWSPLTRLKLTMYPLHSPVLQWNPSINIHGVIIYQNLNCTTYMNIVPTRQNQRLDTMGLTTKFFPPPSRRKSLIGISNSTEESGHQRIK